MGLWVVLVLWHNSLLFELLFGFLPVGVYGSDWLLVFAFCVVGWYWCCLVMILVGVSCVLCIRVYDWLL